MTHIQEARHRFGDEEDSFDIEFRQAQREEAIFAGTLEMIQDCLTRIFHNFWLAGFRVLHKRSCMNGLRFSDAVGCCDISQDNLFARRTGTFVLTQFCAYLTDSSVAESVRYCG